jgi:putative chitinase
VGGVPTSAHRLGYAVDFECPGFGDPYTIARALEHADFEYDQLIHEHVGSGWWVHVSFDPRSRKEALTTHDASTYIPGIWR